MKNLSFKINIAALKPYIDHDINNYMFCKNMLNEVTTIAASDICVELDTSNVIFEEPTVEQLFYLKKHLHNNINSVIMNAIVHEVGRPGNIADTDTLMVLIIDLHIQVCMFLRRFITKGDMYINVINTTITNTDEFVINLKVFRN